MIKPDGVKRGLTAEILARIQRKGYRVVEAENGHWIGDNVLPGLCPTICASKRRSHLMRYRRASLLYRA